MFLQRCITTQQKHEVIVCIPKYNTAQTPDGYRTITLPNSDYKLLGLRPVLEENLRTSQFGSVPGNSVIESVSTVREAVAKAVVFDIPVCVLSLDFQEAFDRLANDYIFPVVKICGISPWLVDRMKDFV